MRQFKSISRIFLLCASLLASAQLFAEQKMQTLTGTAFAITKNGYLATNAHLVDNAEKITVLAPNGTSTVAEVVAIDPANNLAILKADLVSNALYLENDNQTKKGTDVSTLGFSNIALQGRESKYTNGSITALSGLSNDIRYFQISVPIQPGDSGGPLLDARGSVVGIVTSYLVASKSMSQNATFPQNSNYAVKVKYLLALIDSVSEAKVRLLKTSVKTVKNNADVVSLADSAVFFLTASKKAQLAPPAMVLVPPPVGVNPPAVPVYPPAVTVSQQALTSNTTAGVTGINSGKLIKIGHAGPLTGAIAHLGQDNENGARLAIEELNAQGVIIGGEKVRFELVTRDDGADPAKAIVAARGLVAEGVAGVVGHLNSGTTIPASKIYSDAGIVEISPSSTNPRYTMQGFSTAFRLIAHDGYGPKVLAQYLRGAVSPKSVVIVDDGSAYGMGIAEVFQREMVAAGIPVTDRISTNTRQTDFSFEASRIRSDNPDLVFYGGMDTQAGPLLKQIQANGLNPVFAGGDGICSSQLPQLASSVYGTEKVYCFEPGGVTEKYSASLRAFREKYRQRFGSNVQIYAPYTYDAVMVLVEAMKKANSSNPRVYVQALRQISYTGVTGQIDFDLSGDLNMPTVSVYGYNRTSKVFKGAFQ